MRSGRRPRRRGTSSTRRTSTSVGPGSRTRSGSSRRDPVRAGPRRRGFARQAGRSLRARPGVPVRRRPAVHGRCPCLHRDRDLRRHRERGVRVKWYVPSWNGDFRLETVEEGKSCRLTVVDPTPHEKQLLERFMKKALKKKLVESLEIPKRELVIQAAIGTVAPLLVKEARPKKTTIAAVRYEGGRLEVVEGTGRTLTELGEKIVAQEKVGDAKVTGGTKEGSGESKVEAGSSEKDEKKIEKKEEKAEAAASVKRGTASCPQCEPGAVAPANEVLFEMLLKHSPEQHDRWARERVVEVTG